MSNDLKLTLFFTEGVGLHTWQQVGMVDRELALYRALVERGVDAHFVTYGGKADMDLSRQLSGITVTANRWGLPQALYQRSLLWTLPAGHQHIFKSNQIAGADLALRAAHRKGAQFIARCGYLLSDFAARRSDPDSAEANQARELEGQVFRGADLGVVTTEAMRNTVIDTHQVTPDKVRVIPNYVQTEIFRPQPGDKGGRARIGFVGRLDTQKNLFALLDAVMGLDVELALVGEGPQHAELAARAREGRAQAEFLGNLPNAELPAFLNSCDAFILPSLYEGHPKALIEAMACGLPVVGTRVPGIAELIEHDQTGLLCETDPDSIRAAVKQLISDDNLRIRLGQNARAYVLEHFALDKIVDQELALYRELLH